MQEPFLQRLDRPVPFSYLHVHTRLWREPTRKQSVIGDPCKHHPRKLGGVCSGYSASFDSFCVPVRPGRLARWAKRHAFCLDSCWRPSPERRRRWNTCTRRETIWSGIELAQLDTATRTIDVAMYSFTDRYLAEELAQLARKGVRSRVYRDREQFSQEMQGAADTATSILLAAGIEVRVKGAKDLMHLKSYAIDGRLLRTGSANWSPTGLKRQDNDVPLRVVARSRRAVRAQVRRDVGQSVKCNPQRPRTLDR
ncbi:MAG: phospholipase D-like domain-containing protein [Janthinobacterium lividum]